MRKYVPALALGCFFVVVAIAIWAITGNIFFLFNFGYIGACLAAGLALFAAKRKNARIFIEFAIGVYLLVGVGFIGRENMQIEGFWYFLFLGVFQGPVIHYLVAKIAGPVLFGRGWCGYACWTAMVLDVLPYKTRQLPRKNWMWVRYAALALSFLFVVGLLVLQVPDIANLMFIAFIVGNALYYLAGIVLAFLCRDNRAFCKYVCPIGPLMKPAAHFAVMRIKCDESKCIHCDLCHKACPMDVDMTDNARSRERGTECILCLQCVEACPHDALKL